jgi:hypothetical protein
VMEDAKDARMGFPGQFTGLLSLAGIAGDDAMRKRVLATVDSFSFTTSFIAENNILAAIYPNDREKGLVSFRASDPPPTLQDAHKKFVTDVRRIVVDRDAGLIRLRVYWHDPNVAADWANRLVLAVNRSLKGDAIREADQMIQYLRIQLDKAEQVDVRATLVALLEAQERQRMLASVRDEYALRVIDPAIAPDLDKYVRPAKALYALLGAFGSFLLACAIAISRPRHASSSRTPV